METLMQLDLSGTKRSWPKLMPAEKIMAKTMMTKKMLDEKMLIWKMSARRCGLKDAD